MRAQREHEAARLAIVQARREEDIHCLVPVKSRRLVGSHPLVDSLGPGLVGVRRLVDSLGLGRWAAAADIHGRGQLLVARCHAAAAAGQQQLVADRSRTLACHPSLWPIWRKGAPFQRTPQREINAEKGALLRDEIT